LTAAAPAEDNRRMGTALERLHDVIAAYNAFTARRLYVREELVVQEWTATATHVKELRRGDIVAEPSGRRIEWDGMDVIPFQDGKVERKDVYSVSILRQVGLFQP